MQKPGTPSDRRTAKTIAMGERIRRLREQNGFTHDQIGAMVGVTGNAFSHYETGRATPKPQRFEQIARILGVTTAWLLTGNEPDEVAKAQTKLELDTLEILRLIPLDKQDVAIAALRGIAESITKK